MSIVSTLLGKPDASETMSDLALHMTTNCNVLLKFMLVLYGFLTIEPGNLKREECFGKLNSFNKSALIKFPTLSVGNFNQDYKVPG